MTNRLYASIASHGYGHLSQSSTVINQLHKLDPSVDITLQCGYDQPTLASWFKVPYTHIKRASEFGMLMDNSVDVQREASLQRYRDFHQNWDEHLQREVKCLEQANPDLVLANVSYLTLAAAQQLGILNIAMCSLNWADILLGYASPGEQPICQQIREIYNQAERFIQPAPHMSMDHLGNRHPVAPLARQGKNHSHTLKQRLHIPIDAQLLLIGMGGIPTELPIQHWPVEEKVHYLVPDNWPITHPNAHHFKQCQLSFIDILCSCDALVTKPGYGSFSEAACNNIPVLYLKRMDWPEEPFLIDWLHKYGRCHQLSREDFFSGRFKQALKQLPIAASASPAPNGAEQASKLILEIFSQLTK